jgi:predicted ester cyclase
MKSDRREQARPASQRMLSNILILRWLRVMLRAGERSRRMTQSLTSKIEAANRVLIAEGTVDAVDEFFTADYVAHGTNHKIKGRGAIRKFVRELQQGFPDLQVEVEILVKAKDCVAWQRTLQGSQDGSFRGFPATGRRVVWRDMVTSRFRDGRIAEDWVITDVVERLLRARKRR